jgi:hypothetical protein
LRWTPSSDMGMHERSVIDALRRALRFGRFFVCKVI